MKTLIEANLWGIHAGKTGDADSLFLKKNCVAVGWTKMGDLSALKPDRDAFKARVAQVYPGTNPGDRVVYPSKPHRQIHLGHAEGDYRYDPNTEPGYPHVRAVKWLRAVPRTQFSQGALYEIGSAMGLFLVKNYADEFRAVIEGNAAPVTPVAQDESEAAVAEDIEETTRDFVLKRLAQELKGPPFADFVAHLLNTMGYRTRISPEGPDGGIDIVAHKDELGFEPPLIKVQVKSSEGSIGDPAVSALYGKVGNSEFGLLVTLGTFSTQAMNFAKSKGNLRLIDGDELVQLVFQHYDHFDSRYKGLLPLRRVYVPEAIKSDEE
jgi:restriction system protein